MRKFFGAKVAGPLAALAAFSGYAVSPTMAGISYTTAGSLYSENFDGFPLDAPSGASIETVYADGWQDDVDYLTSAEDDVSVLGWHLYHPTSIGGEGGFNNHQRFRMGSGNPSTGSFYGFSPSGGDPEKALGSLGATTVAGNNDFMYMGLQLTNNTGQALNRFTLTFDGEQWRDGAGGVENLLFAFSTSATDVSWFSPSAIFTSVPSLTFTAPVTAGTDTGNFGNAAGKVADISATVTNFTWEPGTDIWLRWADEQIVGNDDGMAIDNVRFTADAGGVFGSNEINSAQTGLASTPSTWSNNQAPSAAKTYNIVSGHTVTIDGDFPSPLLTVQSGGTVNFDSSGSGANVPVLVIAPGGALTESVSGNFTLGRVADFDTALNVLELQGDISLTVDAAQEFILGMAVTGSGNLDLNTGAGSTVRMTDSETHTGAIRFNGSGDQVSLEWNRDHGVIEMNSTGANRFVYLQQGQVDTGTLIFNQPGTIVHGTTSTSPSGRLVAADKLVANADVTIDLTTPFVSGNANSERRMQFQDSLEGSGDITIVGMTSDPSNVNTGVGMHEFEIGSSGEPSEIPSDPYSGTITMGGYVNTELRHSLPKADIVVNANARFEMGHDVSATTKEIEFGQITVNSGGVLEIGHEDNLASSTGHVAGKLRLTTSGGQSGDLILNAGSKTVMGITGTAPSRYDAAFVEGDIQLGGVLELWLNPASTTDTAATTYTPVLNDEFVIMSLVAPPLATDFDESGTVDGTDLDIWKGAVDPNAVAGDADADGVTDGSDFLAWQRTVGLSSVPTGSIIGNFTDVVMPTEPGSAWPAGLDFDTVVVGNEVRLRVISVPAASAVPEPGSIAMLVVGGFGLLAVRRRRACV